MICVVVCKQFVSLNFSGYPSVDVSKPIEWSDRVCWVSRSADGSGGVVFVVLEVGATTGSTGSTGSSGSAGSSDGGDRRVAVIKASSSLAHELFGSRLADRLGVRTPHIRLIGWRSAEHKAMSQSIAKWLDAADEWFPDKRMISTAHRAWHGVIEFAGPNAYDWNHYACAAGDVGRSVLLSDSVLIGYGRMLALDVLCHNSDRIPLLWENDGNGQNILIRPTHNSAATATATVTATATAASDLKSEPGATATTTASKPAATYELIAIDNVSVSFDAKTHAAVIDSYCAEIDRFCTELMADGHNSKLWAERAGGFVRWSLSPPHTAPAYTSTGAIIPVAPQYLPQQVVITSDHLRLMFLGFESTVRAAASNLSLETLNELKVSVCDAVPIDCDRDRTWRQQIDQIHIPFVWRVVQQLTKLVTTAPAAATASTAPAAPATPSSDAKNC